jgi:hypothetical protein
MNERVAWQVDGRNGENLIRADGDTEAAAWLAAVAQARAAGMLSRSRSAGGTGPVSAS